MGRWSRAGKSVGRQKFAQGAPPCVVPGDECGGPPVRVVTSLRHLGDAPTMMPLQLQMYDQPSCCDSPIKMDGSLDLVLTSDTYTHRVKSFFFRLELLR